MACSLGLPAGASAHALLLSSTPQNQTAVDTAPANVVLTFSESVKVVSTQVLGAKRVDAGRATTSQGDTVVTIPLQAGIPNGAYSASYRVVSADGHVIDGSIVFSVGVGTSPAGAPAGTVGGASSTADAAAVIARWLHLGALLVLLGLCTFVLTAWPAITSGAADGEAFPRAAARAAWLAVAVFAVGAVAALPIYIWQTGLDASDALATRTAQTDLARVGLLPLLAVVPVAVARAAPRLLAASLAVLAILALLPGLGGHPSTAADAPLAVAVDWVHVLGAGIWSGGVLALGIAVVALRAATDADLGAHTRRAVRAFGPQALVGTGLLTLTGVLAAWRELGGLDGLPDVLDSRWGVALVAKTLLACAAGGIGLLIRRGLATPDGSVRAEATLLGLVVGASALLVGLAPPRPAIAARVPQSFSTVLEAGPEEVFLSVSPVQAGIPAELHLVAVVANTGQPASLVADATVKLDGPGMKDTTVPLTKLAPAHWTALTMLPRAGQYTFSLDLRRGEFDVDQASATVVVP